MKKRRVGGGAVGLRCFIKRGVLTRFEKRELMTNQRILLLSPFFFPEEISTGRYNTVLAEKLASDGYTVSVIASHRLFPSWRPTVSRQGHPSVEVIRGGGWMRYPKAALLRRAALELWYTFHVLVRFIAMRDKPDYVVPVFPPSLFFYALAPLLSEHCKKVGIIHDLQGVYAGRAKGLGGRLVSRAVHFVEARCFKSCDRLIFLSSSMAARAIAEYKLAACSCTVCYPFAALGETRGAAGNSLAHVFDDKKINVVYSGAMGDKQNPDRLFRFLNELARTRSDVGCYLFSAGPHFDRLRNLYENTPECFIRFHDLVAASDLQELYARSDVQVIPQAFGTEEGSLPSKFPNLLAAGVPLFVICEARSELGDLVKAACAGSVANTWEISELVRVFTRALPAMTAEARDTRKARLHQFVNEKFSLDCVVNEVIGG